MSIKTRNFSIECFIDKAFKLYAVLKLRSQSLVEIDSEM